METLAATKDQAVDAGLLSRLLRQRMIVALGMAGALILLLAFIRDRSQLNGVDRNALWVMKINWKHCADLVVAGDSRVYHGVSPEAMKEILPEIQVLNFGFANCAYTERYLRCAESVLDPSSARRIMVLGITPLSLTAGAAVRNEFLETLNKTGTQRFMALHCGWIMSLFKPIPVQELLDKKTRASRLNLRNPVRNYRCYYPDGWVAGYNDPENLQEGLDIYRGRFETNDFGPVSLEIIDGLIEQVSALRQRGIEVYGFRPPSSLAMVALENEKSGYDEITIARRFNEAGGIWLEFDPAKYASFDSSHLKPESAKQLSRDLAMRIQAQAPVSDNGQ